eukprot:scaffold7570_cov430-Prasinococcus_capsulatus_cf.AAC.3
MLCVCWLGSLSVGSLVHVCDSTICIALAREPRIGVLARRCNTLRNFSLPVHVVVNARRSRGPT